MKKKLQVFISSTYIDLIEERQAAVEAILSSGHIPAGMELFTAGDESQLNVIKRWIDESDIYLLILGGRYGSIEPQTGKSYIQLEYEYAIETKKPYFSIVIKEDALDEKVKKMNKSVLELENHQKYKDFINTVKSKMCSFFEDTKDIKIAVLNKMSEYERKDDIYGWISGKESMNSKKYADEIIKLIEEHKQDQAKIEELEKKLSDITKKKSNTKSLNFHKDFIGKRANRVLGLMGAVEQPEDYEETVSWVDNNGNDREIEIKDGFEYYFVYDEISKTQIDYLLILNIDKISDKNIEGVLADIRLMLETHKDVDYSMTFKYIIASLQITADMEEKCKAFFDMALQKAKVIERTKFKFEVWNDKSFSLIEEELGLKFI